MAKKVKTSKPRDPYILHILKRQSGAHGKTAKAIRRDEKSQLKKEYLVKLSLQLV